MAYEGDIKISELPQGNLTIGSVFITADYENSEYVNHSHTASEIAGKIVNSFAYTQDLDTTSKVPVGAVNELSDKFGVILRGVLEAGETTLTLTNSHITTSSTIDLLSFVPAIDIQVSSGSITLEFNEQEEDTEIIVEVM